MRANAEQLWDQVFGAKDPDTVLNHIDSLVEAEDFCSRSEGFMDLVEDALGKNSGQKANAKDIIEIAETLLAYAESME